MLTNNIEDAILFVDINMKILDINPVACRLLGWNIEDILDNPYFLPEDETPESHRVFQGQLKHALKEHKQIPFQQALSAKDKITNIVEGTIYPLFDRDQILGVIAIFRLSAPEEEAERLQADFIAMASHNLRTPLMSIQMALDFVLNGNDDDFSDNKHHLVQARLQSQKIASFLQELLGVAQLTQNRQIPLKIKPINLKEVVQSAIDAPDNALSDIQYDLEIPPDFTHLLADEGKVFVIVQNLVAYIRNRCSAQVRLKIIVEEKDSEVVISICDNGPPLPVEQYQQVFWQVYPSEIDSHSNDSMSYGYNIGLFGIRRLVELLGGRIWISQAHDTERLNPEGIRLNFTLPIRRDLYATNFNNR